MHARALALVTAVLVLGATNALAWRGRTVTTTTITEVSRSDPHTAAAAPQVDGSTTDRLVERGRNLFRAKGCAACHIDVQSGPNLTNLGQRAAQTKSDLSADQYVRESILTPNAYKAASGSGFAGEMPTLPVDADELNALVAYLLTL
jgi:mono/diheme cytochrome c family protein